MDERRKYTRWQIDRRARLRLEEDGKEFFCQVKDISYKGLRVSLKAHLAQDSVLRISLWLAEGYEIEAEAWVAWRKNVSGTNYYGLYFSRITDADKDKIYHFLRTHFHRDLKEKWWPDKVRKKEEEESVQMEDRRIFERFSAHFPVRFLSQENGSEGNGRTLNISAKGLGLEVDRQLKLRSNVEIWMDVPDKGEPLYSRGQVVWARPEGENSFQAGIELERADLMGISRFLRA